MPPQGPGRADRRVERSLRGSGDRRAVPTWRIVREEGTSQAADTLMLIARPNAQVTLAEANRFVHQARRDPVSGNPYMKTRAA